MGKQKGFDSYLYVNTGTYGSPTWTEVDCCTDVNISEGAKELEATTRAQARQGFEGAEIGLAKVAFKFDVLIPIHGESNTAYEALKTALRGRTTVDVLRTDGAASDHDGAEACRMIAGVFGGERKEPVAGVTSQSFELSNVGSEDQEYPQYGTMSGGDFVASS